MVTRLFGVMDHEVIQGHKIIHDSEVIGFHEVIHGKEVHSWSRGYLGLRGHSGSLVIVDEIIHGHEVRGHEVIQDFKVTSYSWSFMARRTFPVGRTFSFNGSLTVTLNVMYS
jgi:hypothetical protein